MVEQHEPYYPSKRDGVWCAKCGTPLTEQEWSDFLAKFDKEFFERHGRHPNEG